MLYDYIVANYEKDEPIFLAELPGKSEESIRQGLRFWTEIDKDLFDSWDIDIEMLHSVAR